MRPRIVGLRRAAAGAAWIAVGVALAALLVSGAALATGVRTEIADQILPDAVADDRLVVLGIDDAFVDRGSDGTSWATLIDLVGQAGAEAVVIPGALLALANPGYTEAQWEVLAVAALEPYEGLVMASADVVLSRPPPDSTYPVLVNEELSPALAGIADGVGFGTAVLDLREEEFRTAPLVAERPAEDGVPGALAPSSVLVALIQVTGVDPTIDETAGGLDLGGRRIPAEGDQRLRVAWAPELLPDGSAVVTATELLDGGAERLDGAVVVVGTTGAAHGRFVPSPVGDSGRLASPYVEAQVINTLLTEQYLEPASIVAIVAASAGLAFLIAFLVLVLPLWLVPLVPFGAGAALWVTAGWVAEEGTLADPGLGLAVIVAAFAAGLVWRVVRELNRRREVTKLFTRYVPEKVARQLVDQSTLAEVTAGQRVDASVVFCDLRGFTPLCAQLEAQQVRELLDVFYQHMTDAILGLDGSVMQFVGDEVYAVFGAPVAQPDHADRAVACPRAMLDARPAICRDLSAVGLPPIDFGVGVNSGEVVAAHTGSDVRRQYTVLGDTVNVGARLCSSALAGEAIVADATIELVAEPPEDATPTGGLDLKGIDRPFHAHRFTSTATATSAHPVESIPPGG